MKSAAAEIKEHREHRRSPCGERGLKCCHCYFFSRGIPSLPVRGAWVEIAQVVGIAVCVLGRSPCGERGLKLPEEIDDIMKRGRSPCGERGLKCSHFLMRGRRTSRSPCGERGLK